MSSIKLCGQYRAVGRDKVDVTASTSQTRPLFIYARRHDIGAGHLHRNGGNDVLFPFATHPPFGGHARQIVLAAVYRLVQHFQPFVPGHMPNFSSCLSEPSGSDRQRSERGQDPQGKALLDSGGYRPGCPFCGATRERGFDVVKETEEMIAFRDRYVGIFLLDACAETKDRLSRKRIC